jgi:uncharacterized membrane protein
MQDRTDRVYFALPQVGCLLALFVLATFCLFSFFIDVMSLALQKLHLSPTGATLALAGMLLGGFINIPVYRLNREEEQTVVRNSLYGAMGWIPIVERTATQTILAVNVGGCVVPVLIGLYEFSLLFNGPGRVQLALLVASAVNIYVCYRVARPIAGLGIAMPGFISPLVAVGLAWLLLASPQYGDARAPVAFIAGICGPLIGADLLHYRDFPRISAGVVSIGGAGTFDGIVLSGLLAALLA